MLRLILLIGLLCVPIVQAADPPPPNPDRPVNYVKWVNEKYGQGITENAADKYMQAVAAFQPDDELKDFVRRTDPKKWTSAKRQRLQSWIEKNAASLDSFAAAARMSQCFIRFDPKSESLVEVMLPETAAIRDLGVLTATRARLCLLKGDIDGATEDIVTLMRAGRHMQGQPFLIQYLVGLAVGAQGYQVLLDVPWLAHGPIDFDRIHLKLKGVDRAPRRATRQFECEKITAWDMAQRFVHDTDGDGSYDTITMPADFGMGANSTSPINPQQFDVIIAEIDRYFEQVNNIFVTDYQESRKHAEDLNRQAINMKGTVIGILSPSLTRTAVLVRIVIARRNAYRVIFYLHDYHAQHDRWPQNLAYALPSVTARKLNDPFSGKPFGYRIQDGEPLLYTVGENGVDDRGEIFRKNGRASWGKTGDYVFWPRQY